MKRRLVKCAGRVERKETRVSFACVLGPVDLFVRRHLSGLAEHGGTTCRCCALGDVHLRFFAEVSEVFLDSKPDVFCVNLCLCVSTYAITCCEVGRRSPFCFSSLLVRVESCWAPSCWRLESFSSPASFGRYRSSLRFRKVKKSDERSARRFSSSKRTHPVV